MPNSRNNIKVYAAIDNILSSANYEMKSNPQYNQIESEYKFLLEELIKSIDANSILQTKTLDNLKNDLVLKSLRISCALLKLAEKQNILKIKNDVKCSESYLTSLRNSDLIIKVHNLLIHSKKYLKDLHFYFISDEDVDEFEFALRRFESYIHSSINYNNEIQKVISENNRKIIDFINNDLKFFMLEIKDTNVELYYNLKIWISMIDQIPEKKETDMKKVEDNLNT